VKKYTVHHEWIALDTATPTIATIGITKYAADALGDVVYVELPAVDAEMVTGKPMGAVESVKSASDIYSPVDGTVVEVNEVLAENPWTVNKHPEGAGWMVKVQVGEGALEKEGLMGEDKYRNFTEK
jgi:glycine cleavage system H protein